MSACQITDHGCHIILESNSCCVQDLHTGLLVGTGPRCHNSQRLWELDWLRLPSTTLASYSSSSPASASAASTTTTFAQWHRRLGHLSGSRLSTLVGSGVLGLVSGDVALHWVVSLANSYSSPILLVTLFRSTLLISFTLMYGVVLLLSQKGVIPTMSYLLMIIRDIPRSILCHLWLVSDYLPAVYHYDSHSVRFSHSRFSS